MKRAQRGYLSAAALVLMALVTSLSLLAVQLAARSTQGQQQALLGARAWYAADAGLHWGMVQVEALGNCPASSTLSLAQGGLSGMEVHIACTRSAHTEAGNTLWVYHLVAEGRFGTAGDFDAVSRQLELTFLP